jgi:flagella basal body P-ring formation protein FlgA
MMTLLPLLLAIAALSCQPIQSDKILGRDLALADRSFASLPPDASFGFAPIPGRERRLGRGELERIAETHGIEAELPESICLAWPTAVPSDADLLAAMHKALGGKNVSIELAGKSLEQAPRGEITFSADNLPAVADGAVVWRGYVQYVPGKKFWIWARVRLTLREQRLIATEKIMPGDVIRAEQIRVAPFEGPLSREQFVREPVAAVGMVARNMLTPGSYLKPNLLEAPKDVQRGDRVQVLVQMPNARVEADGIAEGDGRKGSFITVRNAKSGRAFLAQVQDKGKVIVQPDAQSSLVAGEKGW